MSLCTHISHKYAHGTLFLLRCRCSMLALKTSSSFTPGSRRYRLQGSFPTSCFLLFSCRSPVRLMWQNLNFAIPEQVVDIKREVRSRSRVASLSPAALAGFFYLFHFIFFFPSRLPRHTSLSRPSTRCSTFNSTAAIARTWGPAGVGRLKLTFSAVLRLEKKLQGGGRGASKANRRSSSKRFFWNE